MAHKFDPKHRELLDSPDRLEWQNPQRILGAFGIGRGMVVADVGCGTGFFSLPLAELVGPSGRVYGVDMQEEMVWSLQARLVEQQAENVLPVLSLEDIIPLTESSIDAVLLVNTLHELAGDGSLDEIYRILKSDGFLAVVDWKKEPMDRGPPLEHRLSANQAKKRLRSRGFEVADVEVGPLHYGIKARKGRA